MMCAIMVDNTFKIIPEFQIFEGVEPVRIIETFGGKFEIRGKKEPDRFFAKIPYSLGLASFDTLWCASENGKAFECRTTQIGNGFGEVHLSGFITTYWEVDDELMNNIIQLFVNN